LGGNAILQLALFFYEILNFPSIDGPYDLGFVLIDDIVGYERVVNLGIRISNDFYHFIPFQIFEGWGVTFKKRHS
jgi:hypothetical protein